MSTPPNTAIDFGLLLNVAYGAFKERLHTSLATAGFDDLGPSFGYVFRSLASGPLSLVQLATLLGGEFILLASFGGADGAALMVDEVGLAIVRALAIGPAIHFHLEKAEIDPEL